MRSFFASPLSHIQRRLKLDVHYLVKSNFWLTGARITAVGSGMILTVLFANLLTPEAFGFYKYAISLAGIIGAFSLTGIGTALVNSIARGDEGTLRTTFRTSMLWSLPGSGIALIIAGYYLYRGNTPLSITLLIIAVSIGLSSFGNYRHLFAGRADFRTAAIVGTIRSVLPIAFIAATLFLTHDPLHIVASYFISSIVVTIALYFYTVHHYQVPTTTEGTESTLHFARYTSMLGFFTQVTSQADQFLMWHFVGPAGVAFYSLATSPVEQLQSFSGSIFALTAPKLATKSEGELRTSLPLRMKQMFFGLVPFVLLYILCAPFLFHFLFPAYTNIVWLSQIYAIVILLQPLGLVDAALIALEDTGKRNWLIVSGQVIKLGLLVVGISLYGMVGGVAALIAAEIFNALLSFIILMRLRANTHQNVY
jgi:O-antigen/teichoic acid export membrane protein